MTPKLLRDPLLERVPEIDGLKILEPVILLERIGSGAMGAVYQGRHLNLDLDVAVKCMKRELAETSPECVSRFLREARLAAEVNSPHLIRVYDVNRKYGLHYLVMELVDGETLHERIDRRGPLDAAEAVALALRAARGLATAHDRGTLHRDIKPDNILVSLGGEVKVADLGLAKAASGFDSLATTTRAMMGTPQFMPPEQFEDAASVSPASDVYALGATLYFMLVGRNPFPGETLSEIMRRVCLGTFPDLAEARSDLPAELIALVRRATSHDACDRHEDAGVLMEDLTRLGAQLGPEPDLAWKRGGETARTTERLPSSVVADIRERLDELGSRSAEGSFFPATMPPRIERRRGPALALVAALLVLAAGAFISLRGPSVEPPDRKALLAEVSAIEAENPEGALARLEQLHLDWPDDGGVALLLTRAYRRKSDDLERLNDLDGAYDAVTRASEVVPEDDRREGVAVNLQRDRIAAAIRERLETPCVSCPERACVVAEGDFRLRGRHPYAGAETVLIKADGVEIGRTAIVDGMFDIAIEGAPEGALELEIVSLDRHDLAGSALHPLVVDATAPELSCEVVGTRDSSIRDATVSMSMSGAESAEDFIWTRSPTLISGRAVDATHVVVTVDGEPVEGAATWNATLTLPPGRHVLHVGATDAAGNVTMRSRIVRVDTTPPTLDVRVGAEPVVVRRPEVALVIAAADAGRLVSVSVAGVEVPTSLADGKTSHVHPGLVEGENLISVAARDAAGNVAERTVTVILDTSATHGRIVSPSRGQLVAGPEFEVVVEVDEDDVGEVLINGAKARKSGDRRYSHRIAVAAGQEVVVEALVRDRAGHEHACRSISCRGGRTCGSCEGTSLCRGCRGSGNTTVDCKPCVGGVIRRNCRPCHGQGTISCRGCGGDGRSDHPCRTCHGSGRVRCNHQGGGIGGGFGGVRGGIRIRLCLTCNGSNLIKCRGCDGKKRLPGPCNTCRGRNSRVHCSACQGGRTVTHDCNACRRLGTLTELCRLCTGGHCRTCEGRGLVR